MQVGYDYRLSEYAKLISYPFPTKNLGEREDFLFYLGIFADIRKTPGSNLYKFEGVKTNFNAPKCRSLVLNLYRNKAADALDPYFCLRAIIERADAQISVKCRRYHSYEDIFCLYFGFESFEDASPAAHPELYPHELHSEFDRFYGFMIKAYYLGATSDIQAIKDKRKGEVTMGHLASRRGKRFVAKGGVSSKIVTAMDVLEYGATTMPTEGRYKAMKERIDARLPSAINYECRIFYFHYITRFQPRAKYEHDLPIKKFANRLMRDLYGIIDSNVRISFTHSYKCKLIFDIWVKEQLKPNVQKNLDKIEALTLRDEK